MTNDCQLIYESYITEVSGPRSIDVHQELFDVMIDTVMTAYNEFVDKARQDLDPKDLPDFILNPMHWRPSPMRDKVLNDIIDATLDRQGIPPGAVKWFRPHLHSLVLKKFVDKN